MSTWQERHIADAERMIAFARSCQPGKIGAVPLAATIEASGSADYSDPPLEILGEHPPYPLNDRHRMYESDFNALCALEIAKGTITWETAEQAMSNFHVYMLGNRFPANQFPPRAS